LRRTRSTKIRGDTIIARMSIRGRRDLLAAINDEPVKMSYLDYLKYIKEVSVSREILFVLGFGA
jgi:hypothetical protein